jgi:hypothetical protein
MAFLPDDTFFGTSPSEQQRTIWLGDVPSDGDPDATVWSDGAAPLDALMQAQADAKHAVVMQTWQQAIRQENDRSKLLAYGPAFQATNAECRRLRRSKIWLPMGCSARRRGQATYLGAV